MRAPSLAALSFAMIAAGSVACSNPAPGGPTRLLAAAPPAVSAPAPQAFSASVADASPPPEADAGVEASAPPGPGEHWTEAHRSAAVCDDEYRTSPKPKTYRDPHGSKRKFGYDGYVWVNLAVEREIDGQRRLHCVQVLWPPSEKNNDGKRSLAAKGIKPSWFRLIERTMQRLPWRHLQAVERFVIDDRPLLHGVAPFDRGAPGEDARDGHTVWLNSHLFRDPNHWIHGNYGHYWGYHWQREGVVLGRQGADHDLFSPVLLHEIGHIVNYNVVNGSAGDPTCPKCSEMCGDVGNCKELTQEQREAQCATAYCTGFGHESGTENWAEMYRWFYQGKATRELLEASFPGCYELLAGVGSRSGHNDGLEAPWERGLGQTEGYRKTRWDSCKGQACRGR